MDGDLNCASAPCTCLSACTTHARERRYGCVCAQAKDRRAPPCSRHKPLGAQEKPQKKLQQSLLETARRAEERRNFSVHGKSSVTSPAFLSRKLFWCSWLFSLGFFFMPFVFFHLSVWGPEARAAWMSGGTETKDPVDLI